MAPRRTSRSYAAVSGGSLLGAAVLCGALRWRDPHVPGSWGFCPWLVATGTPCPTCGGLRALADLLDARPGAAFAHHPYLVVSLALALAVGLGFGLRALARRVGGGPRPRRSGDEPAPAGRRRADWLWPSVAWLTGLVLFGVLRAATPAWWPPLGAA